MRYTRYNYKKNGIIKVLCTTVGIIVVTVLGGLYISSAIFKGNVVQSNTEIEETKKENTEEDTTVSKDNIDIIVLQCGYFSKKENAENSLASLSSYCQPFIVEEGDKYRVIAGIYEEETGVEKLNQFKEQGIDVAKVKLNLDNGSDEDKIIKEVSSGFLEITKKLDDSSIKSINTSEFKEWSKNIISSVNSSDEKINKISEYIDSLPDELQKDNVSKCEQDLYSIIQI